MPMIMRHGIDPWEAHRLQQRELDAMIADERRRAHGES